MNNEEWKYIGKHMNLDGSLDIIYDIHGVVFTVTIPKEEVRDE